MFVFCFWTGLGSLIVTRCLKPRAVVFGFDKMDTKAAFSRQAVDGQALDVHQLRFGKFVCSLTLLSGVLFGGEVKAASKRHASNGQARGLRQSCLCMFPNVPRCASSDTQAVGQGEAQNSAQRPRAQVCQYVGHLYQALGIPTQII